MSLKDIVGPLGGKRRRFILLRVADVDTETSRKLCHIPLGTYNNWLRDSTFVDIYRQRDTLAIEYKRDAINLLRRDNQLEAILLEEKIIQKMKEEIDTGEYSLVKTNLAREVYSKLISDLDVVPQVQAVSWQQRITNLFTGDAQVIEDTREDTDEGNIQADPSQTEECETRYLLPSGEQRVEQAT